MIITLLIFVIILSVLVMIHEFGHFFAAKKFDVMVEEFGFGLPPRAIGKKRGETIYSLNWLPFGGFVRLLGEDFDQPEEANKPRSFSSKRPWVRAVILVAGVFMNVLLALAIYAIFFVSNDYKSLTLPLITDYNFRFGTEDSVNTVVTGYLEGSPAEAGGIHVGEAIIEIDGVPVYSVAEIQNELKNKVGQVVVLQLMDVRDLERTLRTIEVVPEAGQEGNGQIGVLLTKAVTLDYSQNKALAGPMHAYNVIGYSVNTFGDLAKISVEEKTIEPVSASVAGPVGIFGVVSSIIEYGGKEAFLGLLDLVALLSLSLAILNILPFPALDGGRLVFVVFEGVTGKRVSPYIEANIHKWGMIALISLLLLVTFKDVTNLFNR
jgi:regulator of sigma E protease